MCSTVYNSYRGSFSLTHVWNILKVTPNFYSQERLQLNTWIYKTTTIPTDVCHFPCIWYLKEFLYSIKSNKYFLALFDILDSLWLT